MCTAYGRLYIDFTRAVGVVWVCRRFEYSHFCRRFDPRPGNLEARRRVNLCTILLNHITHHQLIAKFVSRTWLNSCFVNRGTVTDGRQSKQFLFHQTSLV